MVSNTNIPIRHSIGFNLLRGVFSIYIVVAVLVTLIHMLTEYFNVKNMIQIDLALYQTTYEKQLSDALWDLEEERIKTISEGIIKLPAVTALRILDTNNNPIVSMNMNETKHLIEHKFAIKYRRENESSLVGYGIFYSDRETVFNKLSTGFTLIIINSVIKTLALWGGVLWLVRPLLIRPLESLTASVKNITIEELDELPPLITAPIKNELVILSESFYDMRVRLKQSLMSVQLTSQALNVANNYLEQLLQSAQQMMQASNKQQLVEHYTEYLFQGIEKIPPCSINFIYTNYLSTGNKVFISLDYEVNRNTDTNTIDLILANKQTLLKLPKLYQNIEMKASLKNTTMGGEVVVPFIWKNKLLATMNVSLPKSISFSDTDHAYLITLNQLLTLTIKQVDIKQQLENKVKLRTSELEVSHHEIEVKAQELEKTSQYKTKFLANMSHEIRTPMNSVFGSLQLLQQSVVDNESKELVATALSSSNMLLTILNDILDLSKIEAGKLTLELNEFNIVVLIKATIKELQPEAKVQQTLLVLELENNLQEHWVGDAIRVRQILLNIIANATKFTKNGKVTIRVSANEQGLFIEVNDTGIGMTEETLSSIFERFEQADSSTTRQYGGTGLGTNIALNLSKLMKGNINAKSKLGEGSQFIISLPLSPAKRVPKDNLSALENTTTPQLSETKVLLAEDNAINRTIFNKLMSPTSAQITVAVNGEECVELFKNSQPDLIFMDIQMPLMDGITACELIKKESNIPIIALTANVMKEDVLRYEKAGFDAVLSKPIVLDNLYQLCSQYGKK